MNDDTIKLTAREIALLKLQTARDIKHKAEILYALRLREYVNACQRERHS